MNGRLVQDFISGRKLHTVAPDHPIYRADHLMFKHKHGQLAVVDSLNSSALHGWITLNDIARQQNAVEGRVVGSRAIS